MAMNVRESRKSRHLVIRLGRGDELPSALVRALDEAEARSGFVRGVGALEAAEVAVYDQAKRSYRRSHRVEGGCEVIALEGNVATLDGVTTVRLSAMLSREDELGMRAFGGQLVSARVFELELDVTVLDDVSLSRVADDATGLPALVARAAPTNAIPAPPAASAAPPAAAVAPPAAAVAPTRASVAPPPPAAAFAPAIPLPAAPPPVERPHDPPPAPAPAPAPAQMLDGARLGMGTAVLPQKPMRARDDIEFYPDVGDRVTHFAFGDCMVIGSDGDRIRLQQEKDSRVREVALTMLKIEDPVMQDDGKRYFKLGRKH